MDIYNRIMTRLYTLAKTDTVGIPDPKIGDGMEEVARQDPPLGAGTESGDHPMKSILGKLGLKDTPENRALIMLIPLYGLSFNEESARFILGKGHWSSFLYEHLLERILEYGNIEGARAVEESFPDIHTLPEFLKNLRSNMNKIWGHIIEQSESLAEGIKSESLKTLLGDIYSNILLQLDNSHPFYNVQIPVRIRDRIYSCQVWCGRERDVIYLEFMLPNLNKIGCLMEEWRGPLKVALYTEGKYHKVIKNGFPHLKSVLNGLGYRCKSLEVYDIARFSGLADFLSDFKEVYRMIDLSI